MNGLVMQVVAARILALSLALVVPALAAGQSHAKDTGLIFVSNEKTNNLIVLDPKTYQVVKDIKVSRRPRDMHFSADRSKLYVACGDDDVIDIIDVAKLEVVGKRSWGITLSRDETKLFVANGFGDDITVIDTKSRKPIVSIPVGRIPWGVIIDD